MASSSPRSAAASVELAVASAATSAEAEIVSQSGRRDDFAAMNELIARSVILDRGFVVCGKCSQ
jgi:hypothetical protein